MWLCMWLVWCQDVGAGTSGVVRLAPHTKQHRVNASPYKKPRTFTPEDPRPTPEGLGNMNKKTVIFRACFSITPGYPT